MSAPTALLFSIRCRWQPEHIGVTAVHGQKLISLTKDHEYRLRSLSKFLCKTGADTQIHGLYSICMLHEHRIQMTVRPLNTGRCDAEHKHDEMQVTLSVGMLSDFATTNCSAAPFSSTMSHCSFFNVGTMAKLGPHHPVENDTCQHSRRRRGQKETSGESHHQHLHTPRSPSSP